MLQYTLLPLDNLNVLAEKSGSVAIDHSGNLYVSHTNGIVMVPGRENDIDFSKMSNERISEFILHNVKPPRY